MGVILKALQKKKDTETEAKKTDISVGDLDLASPWCIYVEKLHAFFDDDEDIQIDDDITKEPGTNLYEIGIKVFNHRKFEALHKLLPEKVEFGNIELQIYIYDMENQDEDKIDYEQLFYDLFEDNDIFDEFIQCVDYTGTVHNFAIFNPVAVQFYSDDIGDPYGNTTMLAQDVAKDIFWNIASDVRFCTRAIDEDDEEFLD